MSNSVDPVVLRAVSVAGISITVMIALCLLLLLTRGGRVAYQRIEKVLSRLAERRILAGCVLLFFVIGGRLLALPLLPVPTPGVHDEFSYLLMADTFAHGRLTNPTHPLWPSFETFHVNWHPTYASMYPPAQGVILAIGQLLGHPWIGVLLSDGAMCVAIFWALQGWMPSRWAFLGAVIAALKLGFTTYWINSYWGGTAASIGGALVIGALARIARRARTRDALLLALGVVILANSRPYEGLLLCLPTAAWLALWLSGRITSTNSLSVRLRKAVVPIAAVLILAAAAMGYYNWRLTGNAMLMPRALNDRTYYTTPLFLWQQSKPKFTYNNTVFDVFYNGWLRSSYRSDWPSIKQVTGEKLHRLETTYFWSGALIILLALPFVFRDRKIRLLWFMLAINGAGMFALVWSNSHYAAPLTCVFYALLVQAIRHLRTMRFSSLPLGVALSRVMLLMLLLDTGTQLCYGVCDPLGFPCEGNTARAAIAAKLRKLPGKHLVIVRYSALHNPHHEWVFNGADIDGGHVLWARELSVEQNLRLLAYFDDRQIWLVEPDSDPQEIKPYVPLDAPKVLTVRGKIDSSSSTMKQSAVPVRKEN
jgi:hypothetical protein